MYTAEQIVQECIIHSDNRFDLWIRFIQFIKAKRMVEVGVCRGEFATKLLEECDSIEKYYMIDPWRHLYNWNKPANKDDKTFEQFFSETKAKTDFAAAKRIILRGKTTDVIDQIPDGKLDFAYIDGDHTLKGIAIDLILIYPKIRSGGYIAGDDFNRTIWQHHSNFEPTLVFPFAIYFAEAVGSPIYALPYSQFLIEKREKQSFFFIDLTGHYDNISLKDQFSSNRVSKLIITEKFIFVTKYVRRLKRRLFK